jgi:endonuclease YncB( thermonuclease family)
MNYCNRRNVSQPLTPFRIFDAKPVLNYSFNPPTGDECPSGHYGEKKLCKYQCDGTDISWNDTIKFTIPINDGRVIKVYDGDTITIASKLPTSNQLYRFAVRLHGIDAPEIKGKTKEEKAAALCSKNALSDLLLNKYITLKNVETEKYGRILADVYVGNLNINKWLLENNYAVPYDGGKKENFSNEK